MGNIEVIESEWRCNYDPLMSMKCNANRFNVVARRDVRESVVAAGLTPEVARYIVGLHNADVVNHAHKPFPQGWKCSACGGRGYVQVAKRGEIEYRDCPLCKGKGVQKEDSNG